ncbi:MAG: hypothetical protein CM1200mP31_6740 [Candidatus Neomarinimicrobiota bacterium]|nr:MAG: hypothetical protein CM1200mP31_6740 [Candidatus Neomarinimicrobiota bacterium]
MKFLSFFKMVIIIFLAIKWAAFNDMFTIKNVEIDGINYFEKPHSFL